RHVDAGKFQARKAPAHLKHAKGLFQRKVDARHVADSECNGVAVEAAVREGKRLRIAFDEGHTVVEMPGDRAFASDVQHILVDIADGRVETFTGRVGRAKSNVAGAAGHVEQGEGRATLGRVERIDHDVLPDPVQAHRHQIVHQVVSGCDAVKHVVDERLLV